MPTTQDELHHLVDTLPDAQAEALLAYATYLEARQHDLSITFWPDIRLDDWDEPGGYDGGCP